VELRRRGEPTEQAGRLGSVRGHVDAFTLAQTRTLRGEAEAVRRELEDQVISKWKVGGITVA
jgi:hypothetical protein